MEGGMAVVGPVGRQLLVDDGVFVGRGGGEMEVGAEVVVGGDEVLLGLGLGGIKVVVLEGCAWLVVLLLIGVWGGGVDMGLERVRERERDFGARLVALVVEVRRRGLRMAGVGRVWGRVVRGEDGHVTDFADLGSGPEGAGKVREAVSVGERRGRQGAEGSSFGRVCSCEGSSERRGRVGGCGGGEGRVKVGEGEGGVEGCGCV